MPTIADYVIIKDDKFNLPGATGDIDKEFNFKLESGANVFKRSILAFVLFVHTGQDNAVAFEVKVNGKFQQSYIFFNAAFEQQTLHEVINAEVLKDPTNEDPMNEVKFSITSGFGSLQFGDVILHYQRNI